MIDTHCHLTFPDFASRVEETLDHASGLGVTGCITISTTVPDAEAAQLIAELHGRVWHSAGVHPLYADKGPHDWARLRRIAEGERCVAWGELGLDKHYDRPLLDIQTATLEAQLETIEAAHDYWGRSLPIVLHCREAFDALIPRLRETSLDPSRFVFHCFTGGPEDARACLDFGAMISFTGARGGAAGAAGPDHGRDRRPLPEPGADAGQTPVHARVCAAHGRGSGRAAG